jgi:hypothetical protein
MGLSRYEKWSVKKEAQIANPEAGKGCRDSKIMA